MNKQNYIWTYFNGEKYVECTSFPSAFKKLYYEYKKINVGSRLKIISPFKRTYTFDDAFRLAEDQGLLDKMGNLKQGAYRKKD